MNNIGSYSIIMWLINNESKEKRKRTIETAQYRLDITFKFRNWRLYPTNLRSNQNDTNDDSNDKKVKI